MRPYLAIIFDSLREALASRVLWVLVVGISLVLISLAPLGYRVEWTTNFLANSDFFHIKELARELSDGQLELASPARAVWNQLEAGDRTLIEQFATKDESDLFRDAGQLRRALNKVIDAETLYSEEHWEGRRLLPEAEELLERRDRWTETERKRCHRLLLEGAFPEYFRNRPDKSVTLTYAGIAFPRTPLSESQLQTIIKEWILPLITNLLLGAVAVLIALLVTSTIIPEMFAPGSLHLLLSKPISRSLVFLSRFFGGCFFVLINVSYLLIGLWLIAGWRFQIWNAGLLKCIPLFLFLFIVYYSVSALAGAYWKNPIVAVAVAIGLWGICFVIGLAKGGLEGGARRASLRRIVVGDELLLSVAENDEVAVWSEPDQQWTPVYEGSRLNHGPIYFAEPGVIVSTSGNRSRRPRLLPRSQRETLESGRASNGWQRESLGAAPPDLGAIFSIDQQRIVAVAGDGLHLYNRDLDSKQRGLFGIQLPLPGLAAMAWRRIGGPMASESEGDVSEAEANAVGDNSAKGASETAKGASETAKGASETAFWQPPLDGDGHRESGEILVYQRGVVMRFAADEDNYTEAARINLVEEVDVDPNAGAAIRWVGNQAIVLIADGHLLFLDGKTLSVTDRAQSRSRPPRAVAVSPDHRSLAVLDQGGNVTLSHEETGTPHSTDTLHSVKAPSGTAIALTNDSLWVGSDNRSLTGLSIATGQVTEQIRPPLDNLQRVNRWLIQPLASWLPMPGELGETAHYLLSGKETANLDPFETRLEGRFQPLDPWTPVIRCSIFVAVMLALGCWYIERQEF
ncbi:MAG: ABC transporter permease [Planctomycetales bacterium]|nr:ABC transporter permease [Planctomycetales bacterium]